MNGDFWRQNYYLGSLITSHSCVKIQSLVFLRMLSWITQSVSHILMILIKEFPVYLVNLQDIFCLVTNALILLDLLQMELEWNIGWIIMLRHGNRLFNKMDSDRNFQALVSLLILLFIVMILVFGLIMWKERRWKKRSYWWRWHQWFFCFWGFLDFWNKGK